MTLSFRPLISLRPRLLAWAVAAAALLAPVLVAAQAIQTNQSPAVTSSPAPTDLVAQQKRRLRLLVGGSALDYGVIYTGLTTA